MEIDAGLLLSPFHLKNSIFKSLNWQTKKTKSLENEIYYYLSPSRNISNCIQFFADKSRCTEPANLIPIDLQRLQAMEASAADMNTLNRYLSEILFPPAGHQYRYCLYRRDIMEHCSCDDTGDLDQLEREIIAQISLKTIK